MSKTAIEQLEEAAKDDTYEDALIELLEALKHNGLTSSLIDERPTVLVSFRLASALERAEYLVKHKTAGAAAPQSREREVIPEAVDPIFNV